MKIIQSFFTLLTVASLAFLLPSVAIAAEFHSGQTLTFSPTDQLKDAYIAGNTVAINAPVSNDLVVAGATVNIHGNVENSLLAAGGTVTVDGNVGQSARLAGGTIIINSQITRDLIVFGGEITLTSTAAIQGDVVINGGTVTIDAPVTGKVIVNGGNVTINSPIGSLSQSHVESLTLGPKAVINGNLSYQAPKEAQMEQGSTVKGQTDFQRANTDQNRLSGVAKFSTAGFFYNIFASLIFGFVLLYLFYKLSHQAVLHLKQRPWPTLAWGLGAMFLYPILSGLFIVLSIWLGIAGLILYLLSMMVSFYLAQLLLGWWLLEWWFGRTKEVYQLDWRAVIIGVLTTTILMLVPVVGWLILFIFLIFAIGSLAQQIWNMRQGA